MAGTKIKICGLRRPEDIEYVNRAKPDFCGFIIDFPKSHRSLTKEQVRTLVQKLDKEIIPVGVFVNPPVELAEELLYDGTIRMAQLHGQETEEDIRYLQKKTGKPVIKAFRIRSERDVQEALKSSADYILLDQGYGTGKTFDWNLVPEIDRPWFLAGGLTVENLPEAIEKLHPWAVDLSSSVEIKGCKDEELIRRTVEVVRGAENEDTGAKSCIAAQEKTCAAGESGAER